MTPSRATTASPASGSGLTDMSAASPEQPPGLTEGGNPLRAAIGHDHHRMNFAALGVIVKFILSSRSLVTGKVGIDHAGIVDRADREALRHVEMADAFGAFLRIDDEGSAFFRDGHIRAFRLASRAIRALQCNDFIRHCDFPFVHFLMRLDQRALADFRVATSGMDDFAALHLFEIGLEPCDR